MEDREKDISVNWNSISNQPTKRFQCGFCERLVSSDQGYVANVSVISERKQVNRWICICPNCGNPILFDEEGKQYPSPAFGEEVKHIPDEITKDLYNEARECMKVRAYIAVALLCRKLLMTIAVKEGAEEGRNFAYYVDYLVGEGYIGEKNKKWVDYIREKGNLATHEVKKIEQKDAEKLIKFSEMLLKSIYEYPAEIPGEEKQESKE